MNNWILCSEKMPEMNTPVLCQCVAGMIEVLKYSHDGWWDNVKIHCYMTRFVIAWMPLPEPYELQDSEG